MYLCVPGSLLNYHEGVGTQATSWIPFAWMPVYDEKLAPSRDSSGYNSHTARRVRLEHEALSYVFKDWDARTSRTGTLARTIAVALEREGFTQFKGVFGRRCG